MTVILQFAPSDCRRSRKRLAAYGQKHEQLAREVEQMRQSDALGRALAEALDLELRAEFGADWPRVEEAF